jgi:hypothetical protein
MDQFIRERNEMELHPNMNRGWPDVEQVIHCFRERRLSPFPK